MLSRIRIILIGACGLAFSSAGLAAPSPTTRRAAPAVSETAMEASVIDAASLPIAVKGKLESEPIRRKAAGAAKASLPAPSLSNPTAVKPPVVPATTGLELSRVIMALGVVLTLIFLLRWAGKRFLGGGPTAGRSSRAIQVISRTIISPRQHLLLLQVGQRVLVVADSGGQMSSLSEITDQDEIAALVGRIAEERNAASGTASFGGMVGRFKSGFDRLEESNELTKAPQRESPEPDTPNEAMPVLNPGLASTHSELKGLMRKVRLLSGNFKTSA